MTDAEVITLELRSDGRIFVSNTDVNVITFLLDRTGSTELRDAERYVLDTIKREVESWL